MKKLLAIVCLFAFIGTQQAALAQSLTKEEKKAVKAKLKTFKKAPESYVAMIDKYDGTIKDQTDEIERLKAELDACNEKLSAALTKLSDCEKKNKDLEGRVIELQNFDPTKLPAGKSFLVQIGNYTKFDVREFFNGKKWLAVEETPEGKKYMISYFTTEEEAETFAKNMRKFGIKDTWVAYFEDGKRLPDQTRNSKKKAAEVKP